MSDGGLYGGSTGPTTKPLDRCQICHDKPMLVVNGVLACVACDRTDSWERRT